MHIGFQLLCLSVLLLPVVVSSAKDWRIINGMTPRPHQFPSIVSIQNNRQHFCGGSLLNANTVLTAAHCVERFRGGMGLYTVRVVAGEHDMRQPTGNEQASPVSQVIIHEYYRAVQYGYDIAIVKLQSPIRESHNVRYARISEQNVVQPGAVVRVVGWGRFNTNSQATSPLLQMADVTVVSLQECARQFPGEMYYNNDNICAHNGPRPVNACHGDSGGPLYKMDNEANPLQVGLVSYGSNQCAQPYESGVYTRISKYINWIRQYAR